jgi:hypothetical protein
VILDWSPDSHFLELEGLWLETRFDRHCMAGLAVRLAKFCAVAAGKFGNAEPAALRYTPIRIRGSMKTTGRAIGGVESYGKWGGLGGAGEARDPILAANRQGLAEIPPTGCLEKIVRPAPQLGAAERHP